MSTRRGTRAVDSFVSVLTEVAALLLPASLDHLVLPGTIAPMFRSLSALARHTNGHLWFMALPGRRASGQPTALVRDTRHVARALSCVSWGVQGRIRIRIPGLLKTRSSVIVELSFPLGKVLRHSRSPMDDGPLLQRQGTNSA